MEHVRNNGTKAAGEGILPDFVPQENVTGDVLRGYGPRRGNLERLLRYWRPIMRKPGGFRRCKVILANHPELYPLDRICAWLHHETTGLWPNEGCHHPTMKNCRGKLKKRNWSNRDFNARLRKLTGSKKKSEDQVDDIFFSDMPIDDYQHMDVVTNADFKHAMEVLRDFIDMEPTFVKYIRDQENWEIVGENEFGEAKSLPFEQRSFDLECCGGELIDD
jgi:hypothetical protein